LQSFVELPDNRNNIASPDGFDAETSTNSYCPQPASNIEEYSKPNDSLDLLYDPQSCASSTPSSSAVDVIAVHGLNGSATKTWMHPNGKLWLKDFLPTALPDARIFTYGYDAKVSALADLPSLLFFPFAYCSQVLVFGSALFEMTCRLHMSQVSAHFGAIAPKTISSLHLKSCLSVLRPFFGTSLIPKLCS
jgi:hypothetical protein